MLEQLEFLRLPAWMTAIAVALYLGARAVLMIRAQQAFPSNGGGEWRGKIGTLIEEDHKLLAKIVQTQAMQAETLRALSATMDQLLKLVAEHEQAQARHRRSRSDDDD